MNKNIQKINKLKMEYNKKISILKSNLRHDINRINKSKNNSRVKLILINILIAKCNEKIKQLTNELNSSINNLLIPTIVTPTIVTPTIVTPTIVTPTIVTPTIVTPIPISNKKALLIGINYRNTQYELNGCINDVINMEKLLHKKKYTTQLLTDDTTIKPTKKNIITSITDLLSNAQPKDTIFIHYSGHGSNLQDRNGDENDGKDETIIPLDFNAIMDDELNKLLINYMKPDVTLIFLSDSCNSGTILDLNYMYLGTNDELLLNNNNIGCEGTVICISGCMDSQTSAEVSVDGVISGVMSTSFINEIEITEELTLKKLITNMKTSINKSGQTQTPILTVNNKYNINSVFTL
jgi:hypothetical protein